MPRVRLGGVLADGLTGGWVCWSVSGVAVVGLGLLAGERAWSGNSARVGGGWVLGGMFAVGGGDTRLSNLGLVGLGVLIRGLGVLFVG